MANYDPRALLNPKAQAKEKPKKRMPNYGPQQSRKPAASESQGVKTRPSMFDPKALLNPKATGANASQPTNGHSATTSSDANSAAMQNNDNAQGMSSMLDRMHNLQNREAPPLKRRKIETPEDATSDEDGKKSKSAFANRTGGGILSEHVKEKQKEAAAKSGPSAEAIDLTNDDDDDVLIVSETRKNDDNKRICLGKITAKANAHHLPRMQKNNQGTLGRDRWPQVRVQFKRLSTTSNNIIELYDRAPSGSTMSIKFATIEIKVAAVLCPLLDAANVHSMEARIWVDPAPKQTGEYPGCKVSRSLPLSIVLYSPKRFAIGIAKSLSLKSIWLNDPTGVPIGGDVEVHNPHAPKIFGKPQTSTKVKAQPAYGVVRTQEEMVRQTASMIDSLTNSDEIPEMEPDTEAIRTELQPLQKQALYFGTQHERADADASNFSLWRSRETPKGEIWTNVITNHEMSHRPDTVQGGILADMMGLGKTLSILSIVASTRGEAKAFGDEEASADLEKIQINSKATLIICPKSVMTNWSQQIKEHTNRRFFKTYQYHGSNRTQDLEELASYDIVLAPYGTVAAEFGNSDGYRNALASVNWFRVVLDEAHQIRTPATLVSRACCALIAQRRWAVTGTPVQNSLNDLGALVKFLRVKPFDDDTSWGKHIIAPLKMASEEVLPHLRLLVDSITLRRTKDKVGLPTRTETQVKLHFSEEESAMYGQFSGQANLHVKLMTRDKGRIQGKGYAYMLKAIHRLRAISAHGKEMLSEDDLKELEGLTAQTAIDLGDEPGDEPDGTFIGEPQAYDFLHMMNTSESDYCTNCGHKIVKKEKKKDDNNEDEASSEDSDTDASDSEPETRSNDVLGFINPCYDHLICPRCQDDYIERAKRTMREDFHHECPYCNQYIRYGLYELKQSKLKSFLDAKDPKSKKNRIKWDESTYSGPHTKVKALVDDLKQSALQSEQELVPRGERAIQSVVFSGWTTYLDLIEYALDQHGITSTRLDGTMSIKQRAAVLDKFRDDPDVAVILVSIKAGGQGLNLTTANKVYMMEPQFNPGVEQQAIDRVHRLGQTRDVEIKRFIMEGSIEEKIQKMQERKTELARLAMEKKISKGEAAKKRIEDLRELFK